MKSLPDITLIAIDTKYYGLTKLAIEDTCQKLKFARTIIFTDRPELFNVDEVIKIKAENNVEAELILWYQVYKYINTSHVLTVQWDGWVVNPHFWDDSWLKYDYIGAPWLYGDGKNVGNGGFSLRSKRLMELLATDPNFSYVEPEDNTICRVYRPQLEDKGFKWADRATAERFSFESAPAKCFGFHSIGNSAYVLFRDDYEIRKDLLNKYGVDPLPKIRFGCLRDYG